MAEGLDRLSQELGREISMRSGVHLGEVVRAKDGDIHGDTVNVAARIQELADPGRVVISEEAWRQLRRQPEIHCTDIGSRSLKGLEEMMHLYEVESL